MVTAVFVLMVMVLVANSVVRHSQTAWWRDPGSLFRETQQPETQQPEARGLEARGLEARQPGAQRLETQQPGIRQHDRGTWTAEPHEPMAPRRSPERLPVATTGREPATDVFGRVPAAVPVAPAPEATTSIIPRVTRR